MKYLQRLHEQGLGYQSIFSSAPPHGYRVTIAKLVGECGSHLLDVSGKAGIFRDLAHLERIITEKSVVLPTADKAASKGRQVDRMW